ncbi:hypothetical protein GJT88_01085 [Enterobacteriaceae endosymbiont of Donacia tomentosa]|uniref:2-oxo acid dehydrogenase subunit E2 n=1 Tax=Enterobacteriaceae endosymbiont of Donacia tomentosa TaxID=2675787 RepID=UPI00144909F2|nr:2-oxo acid dehydrogenase subunit E2 [Enterobacteriaceae endosymbiont of Donacia tomentosa]QJC31648.1 hypothetical protein GJT88_01085 [Enterobacteriaceae endosymbiont of Donacia tomentosa]
MNKKIIFPDTGIEEMKVTDILVKEGDKIQKEQPIVVVESDKTSMEIPSDKNGIIEKILIAIGDIVHKDDIIIKISNNDNVNNSTREENYFNHGQKKILLNNIQKVLKELVVPDIGTKTMKITNILVKENELIHKNQLLLVIIDQKNIFEIFSLCNGVIKQINVKINDEVHTNYVLMHVDIPLIEKDNFGKGTFIKVHNNVRNALTIIKEKKKYIHASPLIRKIARKLKIDLNNIIASGKKNRITKEDILKFERNKKVLISQNITNNTKNIFLSYFEKYGKCKEVDLNNIQKITGKNLLNNWINIPHVTQHIETDITELEKFRIKKNNEFSQKKNDVKLTLLSFIIKICGYALKKYPNFNSSLSSKNTLILKKYFNIGVAINTSYGLFVPVMFNVLDKSIIEISKILFNLAYKAKNNKLYPNDMQGGCFTISNLGKFRGNFFTPIINAPEIAILGISQANIKPIWNGDKFIPRLMLPLSLSYDHRVINGVEGINFLNYICDLIFDIRNIII